MECFTPPESFRFQFIDKNSGEDLLANEVLAFQDIKVTDEKDGSIINFSKIVADDYNFVEFNEIGWETEKVTYRIQAQDLFDFTFYVDAENISEDCCTFTRMNEVEVQGIDHERNNTSGFFKILVE